MTAYIRSTEYRHGSFCGVRKYVVTLSRRRNKRVRIGSTVNPLLAAIMAAKAELQ